MMAPMNKTLPPHAGRPGRGFTLIEILIAVAIVAIIAAVALPSYTAYVDRARRADARTQLLQAAQFMQRFYAANDQYEKDRAGNDVATQIPEDLKKSPIDGSQLYSLTVVTSVAPAAYTLTMAPLVGSNMASDACGGFTITSAGRRGVTGSKSRDECWR
jgi:type IV pilus assembly protein PilE